MNKLNQGEIKEKLQTVNKWDLIDGDKIQKIFSFSDFLGSVDFINNVAKKAEDLNHHPDILIKYNKVTITLSTHDVSGLTENDFDLAELIDQVYESKD